jgi:hypothetical protein
MSDVILGIHSNVPASAAFTGGHAWISITEGGKTTTYGLWPDDHPRTPNNGPGWDIRVGMEPAVSPVANRYYKLSPTQALHVKRLIARNVSWNYTHNCSSWATDVVHAVIKEDVDADDWVGVETPRELSRNILLLEKKNPTALTKPKPVVRNPSTTSWPQK